MHAAAASLALLLALGLAAGCGGDDDGGAADSFVGVPWVLSAGVDVGAGATSAQRDVHRRHGRRARPAATSFTALVHGRRRRDGDRHGRVDPDGLSAAGRRGRARVPRRARAGGSMAPRRLGAHSGRRRPQRAAPVRGGVTAGRLGGDGVPSRRRRLEPAAGDEDHRQLRRRRLAHRLVRLQHLPDVVHARPGQHPDRAAGGDPDGLRRAGGCHGPGGCLSRRASDRCSASGSTARRSLSSAWTAAIVASYTRATQP